MEKTVALLTMSVLGFVAASLLYYNAIKPFVKFIKLMLLIKDNIQQRGSSGSSIGS